MKTTWDIGDSIDLEYFVALDRDIPYQTLRERDRRIAEEMPGIGKEQALFVWLKARRRETEGRPPGETFVSVLAAVRFFLILFGLVFGFTAGWGFLSYLGRTPINSLYFFVAFLLPQWLFLFLTIAALLPGHGLGLYPPLRLVGALLQRCYAVASRKLMNRLDGEKRLRLQALAGQGRLFAGRLGKVFLWLAAALTQSFACAANIGLLTGALLKITVTDLAFGWQSTLTVSAAKIFAAVRFLSWPWAWLWPEGLGYPSLAQIEGSRILLKEGIARLQTENLVSWWPFLLLCLLVYALLPRLFLWIFCHWRGRRALAQSLAQMPEGEELWQRLRGPVVTTSGLPDPDGEVTAKISPVSDNGQENTAPVDPALPEIPAILIMLEELQSDLPPDALTKELARHGLQLAAIRPLPAEYGARLAFPAAIAEEMQTLAPMAALCILSESWLPPIFSFLELLKELRRAMGGQRRIIVLLIGKAKNGEAALVPPDNPVMVTVWRQKLAALADPGLRLLPFDQEKS
jgi:hypothetical protein